MGRIWALRDQKMAAQGPMESSNKTPLMVMLDRRRRAQMPLRVTQQNLLLQMTSNKNLGSMALGLTKATSFQSIPRYQLFLGLRALVLSPLTQKESTTSLREEMNSTRQVSRAEQWQRLRTTVI